MLPRIHGDASKTSVLPKAQQRLAKMAMRNSLMSIVSFVGLNIASRKPQSLHHLQQWNDPPIQAHARDSNTWHKVHPLAPYATLACARNTSSSSMAMPPPSSSNRTGSSNTIGAMLGTGIPSSDSIVHTFGITIGHIIGIGIAGVSAIGVGTAAAALI